MGVSCAHIMCAGELWALNKGMPPQPDDDGCAVACRHVIHLPCCVFLCLL